MERLESFDRDVGKYEQLADESVSDGMKTGIIIRQLEEETLRNHLILNSERIKRYTEFNEEIIKIRLAWVGTGFHGHWRR